jgi:CHAT domain-containing protein
MTIEADKLTKKNVFSFRRIYSWLGILFLSSLIVCLLFGSAWGQSPLQQGLNQLQNGKLLDAIRTWETLTRTSPKRDTADAIQAQKYLARAYQQAGKTEQAIAVFDQLYADYQRSGAWQQAGQMLIELAQLHSALGQHRRAGELLCGGFAQQTLEQDKVDLETHCRTNSALAIACRTHDRLSEAAALGSLGNVYRLRGDYASAIACLEKSLKIAEPLNHTAYRLAALSGLGNTYASLAKRNYRQLQYAQQSADETEIKTFQRNAFRYDQTAIAYFTDSLALAHTHNDQINELRSLLNLVTSNHRLGLPNIEMAVNSEQRADRKKRVWGLLDQAEQVLERLPDSREKAFAEIRLATLWEWVKSPPDQANIDSTARCYSQQGEEKVKLLLNRAIAIGQHIQDSQSIAFALGRLGHFYECEHQYEPALTLTQQARLITSSQDNSSQNNQYLWEWQAGRILQAQAKPALAISAYESAIQTLSGLRADIEIASRDFQFDFRDTVEPVYRELTALYLSQSGKLPAIETALKTIDKLRLAEVQNYLGEDCSLPILNQPMPLSAQKTAVLSTMMLEEQVAVILSIPQANKTVQSQLYWIPASTTEVTKTVNKLRLKLEKRSDLAKTYLRDSIKVYDWLIRPFSKPLQESQIETIVFIQDGILRSIPMAALYDGQQFLVQHYAIATTPSLALIDSTQLNPASLKALAFGLTQASVVEGPTFFEPLAYVSLELKAIQSILPGSREIMDQQFTRDRLKQELNETSFPIVHLATHGKFGIDSRDTFLVTGRQRETAPTLELGNALPKTRTSTTRGARMSGGAIPETYNEKLTLNQLYQMIREARRGRPLDLITLTACETAVGSDRDALGIAGISLQAGARSAIASLWQVDDKSTAELTTQLYKNLRQGMSRAKALQTAQKTWLQQHPNTHPSYWAALVLVGNWA